MDAAATATAFAEAWTSGGIDGVLSHLADEATLDLWATDRSELPALFAWYEATGWTFDPGECVVSSVLGNQQQVSCGVTYGNAWSTVLESGEYEGSFMVSVEGGEIVEVSLILDLGFLSDVWNTFASWVAINHRADAEVMYVTTDRTQPVVTKDSIVLWQEHSDRFGDAVAVARANETVARAFLEARNDGDVEAALSYQSGGGDYLVGGAFTLGQLNNEFAFLQATEWTYTVDECVDSLGPSSRVACTTTTENAVSRTLGVGPHAANFVFELEDGLITFNLIEFTNPQFVAEVWEPFSNWVKANHSDDYGTMYANSPVIDTAPFLPGHRFPILTDESIALWEEHVAEYVATRGG